MSAFESANGGVWRVGELARLTGLTVRALHHYDQIGLLVPARRSSAGHRLYDGADAGRLYRICVLRRLGFPLERIAEVLDQPQWQLKEVVSSHLVDSRRTATVASRLASRLSALATALDDVDELSAEQLFSTIEEMNMLDSPLRATTSMLVYSDVAAAHGYLVRVLGLTAGPLHTDDAGTAVHGEVSAGHHTIWLHPAAEGYQSPVHLGAATGMTVVVVDDLDEHYRRAVAAGAQVIEEPVDHSYGVREWGSRDCEGQLWYFHSPHQ